MKKFLSSPAGSWFKAFVVAMLTLIIAHGGLRGLEWVTTMEAAFISVLPTIVNWLNSEDPRYGIKK